MLVEKRSRDDVFCTESPCEWPDHLLNTFKEGAILYASVLMQFVHIPQNLTRISRCSRIHLCQVKFKVMFASSIQDPVGVPLQLGSLCRPYGKKTKDSVV